jgi:hypothetical protein
MIVRTTDSFGVFELTGYFGRIKSKRQKANYLQKQVGVWQIKSELQKYGTKKAAPKESGFLPAKKFD